MELRLERVVRLCANMVDAGKHFSQSNGMFIAGNKLQLKGGGVFEAGIADERFGMIL